MWFPSQFVDQEATCTDKNIVHNSRLEKILYDNLVNDILLQSRH